MRPSVGRSVHLVQQHSPEHLAAVVCYVQPPGAFKSDPQRDGTLVNLGLWDCRGAPAQGVEGVPEDQTGKRPNSWHWPERVDESPDEDGEAVLADGTSDDEGEDDETEESA